MGWSCTLTDSQTHETLEIPGFDIPHGGQYAPGSSVAELYVTYNYGIHFRKVNGCKGLTEWLDGLTGAQAAPLLAGAIVQLDQDIDSADYWHATEGNARRALEGLLSLSLKRPDGVWIIE